MAHTWKLSSVGYVVFAIMIFLTGVILSIVTQRRDNSSDRSCTDTLREVTQALRNYESINGAFPSTSVPSALSDPSDSLSWYVSVWPYIAPGLDLSPDLSQPWYNPGNLNMSIVPRWSEDRNARRATIRDITAFTCGSGRSRMTQYNVYPATFVGNAGVGSDSAQLAVAHPRAGVFGLSRHTKLSDIRDGTSNTLLLIDTSQRLGPWIAGGDATVRSFLPHELPYVGRRGQFGGNEGEYAIASLADGSVRTIPKDIDGSVFRALFTINGGD